MPINVHVPVVDYLRFLPEIVLSIFGIIIMLLSALRSRRSSTPGALSLIGIGL